MRVQDNSTTKEEKYTDEELIRAFRMGGSEREKAWEYMYKNWIETVVQVIAKMDGSREEAFDAFHDVAINVQKRLCDLTFQLHSASLKTYVIDAVKYRFWYNQEAKKKVKSTSDTTEPKIKGDGDDTDLKDKLRDENRRDITIEVIDKHLSKRCQKVLGMYFEGKSMKEIALAEGLKDAKKAKKEKHKCYKKLYEKIHGDPVLQKKLKDLLDD